MSFSNTSTGDAPADPYRNANLDTEASVKDKIEDLTSFISACKFGMMTTRDASSGMLVSRCMALAATESGGIDLLFHTNTESGKTSELQADPHANVSFLNASGEWASVSGVCEVVAAGGKTAEGDGSAARELIHKHYSPGLKAWLGDLGDGVHDGGPDDPRIGVIRVRTATATYALVRRNVFSRAAEIAQGALTGKPASVNRLREISQEEVKKWRAEHAEH